MKSIKLTKLFKALPAVKQNEIAAIADMSPQHLSALVRGRKKPTLQNVIDINNALKQIAMSINETRVIHS